MLWVAGVAGAQDPQIWIGNSGSDPNSTEPLVSAVFDHSKVFYHRRRLRSGLGYRAPAGTRVNMNGITMFAAEGLAESLSIPLWKSSFKDAPKSLTE